MALAPRTALDALAKAKLHGSLRDGCVIVLGVAFISASAALPAPQEFALFGLGTLMALIGIVFLGLRMLRSYRRDTEQ